MSSVVEQAASMKKLLGKDAEQFIDLFEIIYSYAMDMETQKTVVPLHREIMHLYETFCKTQFNRPARFTKADHGAIKKLSEFLIDDKDGAYVKKILERLFITWEDLGEFHRTQTEFAQIWKYWPQMHTHATSYFIGDPKKIKSDCELLYVGGVVAAKNVVAEREKLRGIEFLKIPPRLYTISEMKKVDRKELYKKLSYLQRHFEKKSALAIQTLDKYREINDDLVNNYPRLFIPEVVYAFQLAIKGFTKGWRTPKGYSIDKIIVSYKEYIKLFK